VCRHVKSLKSAYQVGIVFFLVPIPLIDDIIVGSVLLPDLFFDLLPVSGLHIGRVDTTSHDVRSNLVDLESEKGQES
jgi:hypothetical protein